MSESTPSTAPSSVLREEHQVILRVIRILEQLVHRSESGNAFEAESFRRCVEFFRLFADACHHAKEEESLFPAMEGRGIPRDGGPIGVMLHEHTMARRHTREMSDALDCLERGDRGGEALFREAARQYIRLLRAHIDKEDNLLFAMGDQVLTDEDQASLRGMFSEVNCRTFGGKRRDELERFADELEQQWRPG